MKRLSNLSISSIALLALLLPMLVACGMLEVGIEPPATPRDEVTMRATQEEAAGIHVVVAETSTRTVSGLAPMPTSVLDGSHLTFNDPALGLALDIPLWWEPQSTPGAVAHFYQQVPGGTRQTVLTISVLKPESNTLELALDELTQGTWGPYIQAVQSTPLGTFEALRLELEFAADRPPVIWLVVAPSGRAVSIVPDVDPSWIEPVIEVVLDTLHPIPITSRAVSTATLTPPAAETGATGHGTSSSSRNASRFSALPGRSRPVTTRSVCRSIQPGGRP